MSAADAKGGAAAQKIEQVKAVMEKMKPYLEKVGPLLRQGQQLYVQHSPLFFQYAGVAQQYVPPQLVLSLVLLFFGGQFALTICAYRAFQASGGRMIKRSWGDLSDGYKEGMATLRKDSELVKLFDADGDGHVSPTEVVTMVMSVATAQKREDKEKKLQVLGAMIKCVDPQKILDAIGGLWGGVAAVLATLRSDVARYVVIGTQLGTRASDFVRDHTAERVLEKYPQYAKWISAGYKSLGAILGILLAFLLTRVIMALNSALEGGRQIMLFGVTKLDKGELPFKVPEDTAKKVKANQDKLVYAVAGFGFLFQLWYGFSVPWYLKLFLWPALLVESVLSILSVY